MDLATRASLGIARCHTGMMAKHNDVVSGISTCVNAIPASVDGAVAACLLVAKRGKDAV